MSRGFSLIEIVVAMGLTLAVMAALFTVVAPSQSTFSLQLEAADLQQRLRVATVSLERDVALAGAGAYAGSQAGSLAFWFAPLLPFRAGAIDASPPETYRPDIITLLFVPSSATQTTLSVPITPTNLTLHVDQPSGCPQGASLCGISTTSTLLIHDQQGNYDTFAVTSASATSAELQVNRPGGLRATYGLGSKVTPVVQRTYQVKPDAGGTPRLVVYDGSSNPDVPVVDHVVSLHVDYYAEPRPPILIRPLTDPLGPWTSYGPAPPHVSERPTAYPMGENCLFELDEDSRHVPRLALIGSPSGTPVLLTPSQLSDGPWCPDAVSPGRFDADLLRVRSVAITVRVEAALASLRGHAGPMFARAGTATSADHWLPDREIRVVVSPFNLRGGR